MKMFLLLKSIFSEERLDQRGGREREAWSGRGICIKLCDELRKCLPSNRGKRKQGQRAESREEEAAGRARSRGGVGKEEEGGGGLAVLEAS